MDVMEAIVSLLGSTFVTAISNFILFFRLRLFVRRNIGLC